MLSENWLPPNISEICVGHSASFTQCSAYGFMYLALLAQLYGKSGDSVDYKKYSPSECYFYTSNDLKNSTINDETTEDDNKAKSSFQLNLDSVTENYNDADLESDASEVNKNDQTEKMETAEEYDFIVVGAGSAGCVVANRLSENSEWKVLLLEAGPEEPEITSVPSLVTALGGSSIDWQYTTQPEELSCKAYKGQVCPIFRGKSMGGSSSINYMNYIRGNKEDYNSWAELGNDGWSYDEVLPYFKKAENNNEMYPQDDFYHSIGGPLNIEKNPYIDNNTKMLVEAFEEKGILRTDFNGQNQLGVNIAQTTTKDGLRLSTNSAYIRPIRYKRANINIITEALVSKILIDPINKTAFGVQYIKNGTLTTVHAKKEVIISTGSINSPKLLMISGIGPKDHLNSLNIPVIADLSVGHNLQDHVLTLGLIIALSNQTSTTIEADQINNEVCRYYNQGPKESVPLSKVGTVSTMAFMKTNFSTTDAPDIQFLFAVCNVNELYADPSTYISTNILPLSFYNGLHVAPVLLTPKSRGLILLNQTDPVNSPPIIYPGFFTEQEDLDVLVEATKFVITSEDTTSFKENGAIFVKEPLEACSEYDWGTNDYIVCIFKQYTGTVYHPVGTCKMGPESDKDAVIDFKLRVYGIKNLRVIDASIMTNIVRGNTNAPTVMIAEKASDMIKEDW